MGREPDESGPAGKPQPDRAPTRLPSDQPDDIVLGFRTVRSNIMGRLVRMGSIADLILSRHDYPEPVVGLLGQSLALATLLGAPLKQGARLTLQTSTDGPVRFLVCHYDSPGRLRGYASFDAARVTDAMRSGEGEAGLLGAGHLALTVDVGANRDRYQGIVPLDGIDLETAALDYFKRSEQLPTYLRLAVARQLMAPVGGGPARWHWRAGGILVQHLSPERGDRRPLADGEEEPMLGEDDDHWQRVRMLAGTVEDHELIDPSLSADALLYRLFHEEGVVAAVEPTALSAECRCSRERVNALLSSFGSAELADMQEADGRVAVTCEFCNSQYRFGLDEVR